MRKLPIRIKIKIRIRRNGTRLRAKPGNSAVRRRANRSKGVSPFSNRPCSSNPAGLDLRSTQLSPPARVRAQSRQGRQMVAGGANHRNSTHFAGNPGRVYRILRTRFCRSCRGFSTPKFKTGGQQQRSREKCMFLRTFLAFRLSLG